MITIEKLKIFEKYNGLDFDRASVKDLKILDYSEYMLTDRLIQDIRLIQKGIAATTYEEQTNVLLEESCDSIETINYLKDMTVRITKLNNSLKKEPRPSFLNSIIKKFF